MIVRNCVRRYVCMFRYDCGVCECGVCVCVYGVFILFV